MIALARRIAHDRTFQTAILVVILLNAVLVGVETFHDVVAANEALFFWLDKVILAVFLFELAVRMLSYWPRPLAFFRDGWNVFDFAVVALSLLPAAGSFATVARLARLLRVVRLISAFPELRLIVGTMVRSVSSMGNIVLLIGLVMYVYGVLGFHLFSEVDPENWGSLGAALLTLFEILTLEGWVELQEAGYRATPLAWLFYGSYILVAVFVVVNLFIAVVLNNLEQVKAETDARQPPPENELLERISTLRVDLERLERAVRDGALPPTVDTARHPRDASAQG
jgi:voltage-gated sodium channel